MPYPVGGVIIRADLRTALEQGLDELKFCIGEEVAPIYESDAKAGIYLFRSLEQRGAARIDENRRAPGTSYPEVTNTWSSQQFETLDFGYKTTVDDSLKAYANRFLDLETSTARILDAKAMLAYEVRVQNALYGGGFCANSAAVTYGPANLATVDFVGDVQNACERQRALGTIPNTIVLSYPLWNFIRRAPLFQNYVRGNFPTVLPTIIKAEQVASIFEDQGIEKILIGGAYQDTGGEGQLYLGAPIWPNSQFFVGKITGGDFLAGGAMRTIAWSEDGGFKSVEAYRDEDKRSDILRVRQSVIEQVIDQRAGQLINTGSTAGSVLT
jgi:hypothetical protein